MAKAEDTEVGQKSAMGRGTELLAKSESDSHTKDCKGEGSIPFSIKTAK